MFVALNKDKKRVHISNTLNSEKYYCPICGEELRTRKGNANAHHFAHKNNSNCVEKDGWHYDMSDWHYDWQNQFPVDNQEIVFAKNNKIHRADVFINNTVIEFQHSPITENEFNDRNEFYKSLGYKVLWIFDAIDKEVEYLNDTNNDERLFSWKHPIRFLKKIDCNDSKLDVFLQTKEGIWYRQPNYKDIKDFQQLNIDNNIIKISDNQFDGLNTFISDDFYSDIEIIDTYYDLKLQNKNKYTYKHNVNIHKLSDEIYNYKIDAFYGFYGYCPMVQEELYSHKECHACNYLDTKCMKCTYRFKSIIRQNISEIYDIKYDRDGRITFLDLEINNQRKKYELKPLPNYTRTLLEFSEKFNDIKVARFVNVENGNAVQLSQYNMKQLVNTKKCYGRLCSDEYQKASPREFEIFNWNKPIWLLTWYKKDDNYHKEYNNYVKTNNIDSNNNNSKLRVPTICPKCGSMIALIDGGDKVGCSKYPKCNYVIWKNSQ